MAQELLVHYATELCRCHACSAAVLVPVTDSEIARWSLVSMDDGLLHEYLLRPGSLAHILQRQTLWLLAGCILTRSYTGEAICLVR